jgi:hypothetical protein
MFGSIPFVGNGVVAFIEYGLSDSAAMGGELPAGTVTFF